MPGLNFEKKLKKGDKQIFINIFNLRGNASLFLLVEESKSNLSAVSYAEPDALELLPNRVRIKEFTS